jgi:hypothetical protein
LNGLAKFVVSVVIFPIVVYVAYVKIVGGVAETAIHDMTEKNRQHAAAYSEQAKQRQLALEQQAAVAKQRHLESAAAETQAAADAARTEQEAIARKESAWQGFFKPRKVCENPPDWDTQVECGNAYIRAKRDFDARWERGEIR